MIRHFTPGTALPSLVFLLLCPTFTLGAEPSITVRLGKRHDTVQNLLTGQIHRLDLQGFMLRVGPEGGTEKQELRFSDFSLTRKMKVGKARWEAFPGVFATAKWGWRINLQKDPWEVTMFLYPNREKGLFYKWFEIKNASDQPQIVWECRLLETSIEVEVKKGEWVPAPAKLSSGGPEDRVASLGDHGIPVFVGSLFYGAQSPLHRSHYDEGKGLFYSEYDPAEVVHPNTTFQTERLVMGLIGPPAPP